jgi:hypothetical protein
MNVAHHTAEETDASGNVTQVPVVKVTCTCASELHYLLHLSSEGKEVFTVTPSGKIRIMGKLINEEDKDIAEGFKNMLRYYGWLTEPKSEEPKA